MNAVLEQRSRPTMQDHASSVASIASYATSVGLVLGKALDFLNTNAAACGVILGFLTFLVNWYYKRAAVRNIKDNGMRRRSTDLDSVE